MPIPSSYPPGVSGNEPQITGGDEDHLVLVHHCGEVFDAKGAQELLQLAGMHGMNCPQGSGDNDDWSIDFYESVM